MNKQGVLDIVRRCVGLYHDQAKSLIENSGLVCRVVSQDGLQYWGTEDYREDRVNVDLIDDVVVSARVG